MIVKDRWNNAAHVLGEGSFGVVKMVMCKSSGKMLAVKTFKSLMGGEERQEELNIFDMLHARPHPNLLSAVAVVMNKASISAIATEYFDEDLDARWKRLRGIMEPSESSHFLYHAAKGLAHLHELGLAHRDVKPSNMLIRQAEII
jgi:serine/threonine protein kinase